MLIFAFRGGSATAPTVNTTTAAFVSKRSNTGTTCGAVLGYHFATSTSDVSGTWTNSNNMVCLIYRAPANNELYVGTVSSQNGTSNTTVSYNIAAPFTAVSPNVSGISVGFGGVVSTVMAINTAPVGMANITGAGLISTSTSTGAYDSLTSSPSVRTAWPATIVSDVGASGNWITMVLEVGELSPSQWSQANSTATLANNFYNANSTGGSVSAISVGTNANTGKYFFQTTYIATAGSTGSNVAIANGSAILCSFNPAGTIANSSASIGSYGAIAANTVVECAVDLTNTLIWVRSLPSGGRWGNWNNSSSANPSTNTGGLSYTGSAAINPVKIKFTTNGASGAEQVWLNTGTFQWAGLSGPPFGFAPWWSNSNTSGTTGIGWSPGTMYP